MDSLDNLLERIAVLESLVTRLTNESRSSVTRGALIESDDSTGMQQLKVKGFYGEELGDVMSWQPFGMSSVAPPGSDALILSAGGQRDGAQVVCVSSPAARADAREVGSTTIFDINGNQIFLSSTGIRIASSLDVVVEAAGSITLKSDDVRIEGAGLTHNGVNIGDDHKHTGIQPGGANTGDPVQ